MDKNRTDNTDGLTTKNSPVSPPNTKHRTPNTKSRTIVPDRRVPDVITNRPGYNTR